MYPFPFISYISGLLKFVVVIQQIIKFIQYLFFCRVLFISFYPLSNFLLSNRSVNATKLAVGVSLPPLALPLE